ncbi:MAG: hypothetical protein ACFFG0_03400 [Candidatus Thorarchaeota archaeon]
METRVIQLDNLQSPVGKKYLEDLLRELFLLAKNPTTGTYEGTGSNVSVDVGFRPEVVKIKFVDGGGTSIWVHDDIDPACNYEGDAGAAGAAYNVSITDTGFTATGAQVVANGETFFYEAIPFNTIEET